jgi:DnaJ-class molecular chaperone
MGTNKYQQITEARNLLELPERASMEEIKSNYRNLIRQWHPDTSKETREKCTEVTAGIIAAYNTIIDYCNQYSLKKKSGSISQKKSGGVNVLVMIRCGQVRHI